MQFRVRVFAPVCALAMGVVTLADAPVAAMPFSIMPATTAKLSLRVEPARLVCNRWRCWRTYGYRRWYRPYYGYRYYRPNYYLPGLGLRVY